MISERNAASRTWDIRQASPSELPFIYKSWLKSYEASEYGFSVGSAGYFAFHHHVITNLLERSVCLVAVGPGKETDRDDIWGFLCGNKEVNPRILHYIYTKNRYRRKGVARSLTQAWMGDKNPEPIFYSHRNKVGDEVLAHLFHLADWNPYLMFLPWPAKLRIP